MLYGITKMNWNLPPTMKITQQAPLWGSLKGPEILPLQIKTVKHGAVKKALYLPTTIENCQKVTSWGQDFSNISCPLLVQILVLFRENVWFYQKGQKSAPHKWKLTKSFPLREQIAVLLVKMLYGSLKRPEIQPLLKKIAKQVARWETGFSTS